ncbi:hypothetical protein ACLBXM_18050 [Xanthobacteraceae bacterium A53D]
MTAMTERMARAICAAAGDQPEMWERYEPQARAALEAMRAPTMGMQRAAYFAHGPYLETDADSIWTVMVKQALGEPTPQLFPPDDEIWKDARFAAFFAKGAA